MANALNVSPRSVKSYITEINDTLPDTVTSSRKGYVIDKEKAEELLNESKSLIPQTKDERVSYIINRLIKQDTLVINGLEKNKRKLLSSLMYSESHNNFVNYEK